MAAFSTKRVMVASAMAWLAVFSARAADLPPRPVLSKLPFAFSQTGRTPMENTPVLFQSRLLMVANYRPGGDRAKGDDAYLYIDDLATGEQIARFGRGHSFASAWVQDSTLHVFALEFTDFGRVMNSNGITRFWSTDLKTWKQEKVLTAADNEHLFNTSVCRDEQGYVMAYESDRPLPFCFKFARSQDLSHWTRVPDLVFTGVHREYAACPALRYFKPYYYVIYLHAPIAGHNGWISFLARSRDLRDWELSPYNPILEAGIGEGSNNSDVDLIEYEGRTFLYYATGDQATWSTVRVAMYDGPMEDFFIKHFPDSIATIKARAGQ